MLAAPVTACRAAPAPASAQPPWLIVSAQRDEMWPTARQSEGLPAPLRREDISVGIDIVELLRGPRTPAPPPPAPGIRPDDAESCHRLIGEIDEAIARRPGDHRGYELRAGLWQHLGWHVRAARDRAMARLLRAHAAP
jgi:hypothetical protein